jgi:hypothetical protein
MFIENIGYSFISGRAGGGATTGGRSIIGWVCILKFSSMWARVSTPKHAETPCWMFHLSAACGARRRRR